MALDFFSSFNAARDNSRGQDREELDGPLNNLPLDPPGPL